LLQHDEYDQRARLNLERSGHIKSDFKAGDNLPQQRNRNDDEFRQNSSSSLLQRDEHDQRARLNLDDREHIKSDFKAGDNLPQRRPPRQQDFEKNEYLLFIMLLYKAIGPLSVRVPSTQGGGTTPPRRTTSATRLFRNTKGRKVVVVCGDVC
jgi:hypothetical protein